MHKNIATGISAVDCKLLHEAAEDILAQLRSEGRPLPTIREVSEPELEDDEEIREFEVA